MQKNRLGNFPTRFIIEPKISREAVFLIYPLEITALTSYHHIGLRAALVANYD
jgi:hypothetical protein